MKTRFVLIQTSHAGNVGATARAMRVMGFDDLVLVQPRWANVLQREETIQRASGALNVLQQARIVDELEQALEGMSHVCATAMVPRDFGPPTYAPRAWMQAHAGHEAVSGVAFLFGSERFGMRNDDVYRSHAVLTIPTAPDFGSLNLAAAVQLLAYEWRQALGGFEVKPATAEAKLADAQQMAGLLRHWEEALIHVQFLNPQAPKKLMPRLNQLFNRAQLSEEDIHILRGVAKCMLASQAVRSGGNSLDAPLEGICGATAKTN